MHIFFGHFCQVQMFDEDEEELELLRQYEDKALDADDDEKYSR